MTEQDEAVRLLLRYGRHEDGCPDADNDPPWDSCTCGFAAALATPPPVAPRRVRRIPQQPLEIDVPDYELSDTDPDYGPALDVESVAAILHELELGCDEHEGDDSVYAHGTPHHGQARQLIARLTGQQEERPR